MAAGWLQTAVRVLIGLVQIRIILDALGDELTGVWFVFTSLAGYVALFDLGLSPTLGREVGFVVGKVKDGAERERALNDLLATSQRVFRWIAGGVFVLGCAAGLGVLSTVAPEGEGAAVARAWLVFCAGASLNILGNAAFAALYGLGNVAVDRSLQALTQVIGFALLVLAIVLDLGLMGLSVAWVLQGLLLRALGWAALHRLHPSLSVRAGRPSRELLRRLAAPSAKWMLMALGGTLIFNTDNLLIGSLMTAADVPAYHALAQVILLAMQLSLLTVASSTPFVSQAHAEGDEGRIRLLLLRNLRWGVGLMALIAAALVVQGDLLLEVWLGPGRFAGWGVLACLVATLLLETHHRIHAQVVMARGELVFHSWALAAGLLNLAISVLLIGRLGLLGVALGTLLSQLVTNNWYAPWRALRSLSLPAADYLLRTALPLVLLFAVSALAGAAARSVLPADWHPLARLVAGTAASSLVGAVLFLGLVLRADDRRALIGLLRRRRACG